jgi:osmotically-inducible protein OsmY
MAEPTAARTDAEIQGDVLAELKCEPRVQPNEIGVAVKNRVVTLTGSVDSFAKKWAAEEAARRVRGVKALANDIDVWLTSVGARTDADVAAAVVRCLEDAALPIEKLEVTVSKGWVTLSGAVEWQYQKEDAERIVRPLAGVTGVTNLITVVPGAAASGIKTKIEEAVSRTTH